MHDPHTSLADRRHGNEFKFVQSLAEESRSAFASPFYNDECGTSLFTRFLWDSLEFNSHNLVTQIVPASGNCTSLRWAKTIAQICFATARVTSLHILLHYCLLTFLEIQRNSAIHPLSIACLSIKSLLESSSLPAPFFERWKTCSIYLRNWYNAYSVVLHCCLTSRQNIPLILSICNYLFRSLVSHHLLNDIILQEYRCWVVGRNNLTTYKFFPDKHNSLSTAVFLFFFFCRDSWFLRLWGIPDSSKCLR